MDQTLEKQNQGASLWEQEILRMEELPQMAVAELRERFDRATGCFEGLREEQEEGVLLFLLEYARRTEDDWARAMAEASLERRGRSGSPLLAYAGLEAYAQTGRPGFREAACGMLEDALAELRMPGGCFVKRGDSEVSTAWNAQMVMALAKASRVLGEESCLRAARETRLYLKTRLTQSNGRLWRRRVDRQSMEEGRLLDYGFYCWALTELYEADFSVSCLREAENVADRMAEIFRDRRGRFYDRCEDAGRGAAALALGRLAGLTAVPRYRTLAREQLAWLAGADRKALEGLGLLGMVEELRPRRLLVCAAARTIPSWLAQVGEEYRLAVLAKTHDNSRGLENAVPCVREFPVPETGERLYLCRNGVCEAAAGDLFQLYRALSPEGVPV